MSKLIPTSLRLSLSLRRSVFLHTGQEVQSAVGVLDVLNTDVDTLLNVAAANLLVDDDTNRGLGNVVDDTSLAVCAQKFTSSQHMIPHPSFQHSNCSRLQAHYSPVVVLVRHTAVDGTVGLDVNNVSNLVGLQVGGERDGTLLTEVAGEKVPGAGAETCSSNDSATLVLFALRLHLRRCYEFLQCPLMLLMQRTEGVGHGGSEICKMRV